LIEVIGLVTFLYSGVPDGGGLELDVPDVWGIEVVFVFVELIDGEGLS